MSQAPVIRCPACQTKNRVDQAKLAQGLSPVCGKCKQPLLVGGRPVNVTDASYASDVLNWPQPVLLDLWAPWCGPCRAMTPILDELAGQLSGRMRIAKLNVDENPVTAGQLNVPGIPTMIVFHKGRELERIVGMQSKGALLSRLEPLIGSR
jgi:thioredoxin 2